MREQMNNTFRMSKNNRERFLEEKRQESIDRISNPIDLLEETYQSSVLCPKNEAPPGHIEL
jgi:hypothetical protein